MDMSILFFGPVANIFSATCILIILLMTFSMSLRLFLSRRRKAYRSLAVSISFVCVYYAMVILFNARNQAADGTVAQVMEYLQVLSFFLVNLGIYQLYNAATKRHTFMLSAFVLLLGILASAGAYVQMSDQPFAKQMSVYADLVPEALMLIILVLCMLRVSPYIGQRGKYNIGLFVFFLWQFTGQSAGYVEGGMHKTLSLSGNLMPVVYYAIVFMIIFERLIELLQAVYHSSITDGMTGLYNRRYFNNKLNQYINNQLKVSVIFTDIDNFKRLNDTQGHQKADEVLKQAANIIREECEENGVAGRYGGEELVAIIANPAVQVEEIAESIRRRIEAETIVTVSVGYSKYRKGISAEALVKQADQAMYLSKTTGKNKVSGFRGKQRGQSGEQEQQQILEEA